MTRALHVCSFNGNCANFKIKCVVQENNLKKCMKLNWNFQRDRRVIEKIPSVREVWIFSGITQYYQGFQ